MHTFLQMMPSRARLSGSRLRTHVLRRLRDGEDGFLLVEVMVSALLVGLIVTATFNGFDVAQRLTIDQRRHSMAQLLAAESQEQLRSDSATALDALETSPHTYTREVTNNGSTTTYKISQEAKALSSKGTTGCSATGASRENGANIAIITTVTWAALEKQTARKAVRLSSIVTPPVGSALEVDVTDGASPPKAVSGVTAIVKFTPSGAATATTVEGTTGSAGCVVFSGLAATSATVEIVEKLGYVFKTGEIKLSAKTVTIAPNITTQYPIVYAPGGQLTAQFAYKGATTFNGKTVKSDTFVASNASIPTGTSQYVLGSTNVKAQETGEQEYLASAATAIAGYTTEGAATAVAGKYPTGDLFPFPGEWTAYAGDCPKSNVGPASEVKALVLASTNTKVTLPLSLVSLTLKTGTFATKATATTDASAYAVRIKNPECEGYEKPNHSYATTTPVLKHEQKTAAGELENPFQPFGKQTLCIYNSTSKKTYTWTYTNSTEAGNSATLYTGQPSKAERETTETNEIKKLKAEFKSPAAYEAAKGTRETEEKEAKEANGGFTIASGQASNTC